MILKLNSQGESVKMLQKFLKIKETGYFCLETEKSVKLWQKSNGLVDDGIVGPKTWKAMGIATTDIKESIIFNNNSNNTNNSINNFLPEGEYMKGPTKKKWVFLHHTGGWNDPFKTISHWASDTRGPIATEFVIGGQSIKGDDLQYDGKLVCAFPEGGYGWHLGIGNNAMHRESIGIEICSFGQLTKGSYIKYEKGKKTEVFLKPNSFYTYVGTEANINQVVTLSKPFKGFIYWHKYSDAQIKTLYELLKNISVRDNIDMRKGIQELIKKKGVDAAFNFYDVKYVSKHPGLWIHANVNKNKTDVFPQQELVDMIMSFK